MKAIRIIPLLITICIPYLLQAKVKLPAILTNGMVLQRDRPLNIWGTADAGENIMVCLEHDTCSIRADKDGQWLVSLPARPAGGPYTIQINEFKLTNILIGDVWLCSGQSNMELPVSRVTDLFAEEVASYTNNCIRHFKVPNTFDFHAPQDDLPNGCWQTLTPDQALQFSALGYFFAKAVYADTGVPIGIVNSSWGGTPIEAWMSEKALRPFPQYLNEKFLYEDDTYRTAIKQLEEQAFYRWNLSLYLHDPGLHSDIPWYATDYDDRDWKEVNIFSRDWGNNGLNPTGGSHWLRKSITLPAQWKNQEAILRLGCIIDADSVYVNGHFIGTTSYQYPPRIYPIPHGVLKESQNQITVRIISNGGQPAFIPEKPYKLISKDEEITLDGTWRYHLGSPMPPAPSMMFFCYKPVCLYNAMIAPLKHLSFQGVIWYQGESNISRRNEYAELLLAMMTDWRCTFQDSELPFYIVELADFLHPKDLDGRNAWEEMRQQQARAAQADKHATLIPNSDLGEWNDIHPLDKKTLGIRVAKQVLSDMCKRQR